MPQGDWANTMRKKDKQEFLAFVSGDIEKMSNAVHYFQTCEHGHFEEHPISRSLLLKHIENLVKLWNAQTNPTVRNWVIQFIAESTIVTAQTKPILLAALMFDSGSTLRLALYAIGSNPRIFEEIGDRLLHLATHPDYEVRWRVAYVIHYMQNRSEAMLQAADILRKEPDDLIQTYVGEL